MALRRSVLAALAVTALVSATAANASCFFQTPAQQRARAHVIFDGIVLEGPTATGVQRFRVLRYLKGRGPRIVRVSTGVVRRPDGTGNTTSVSIDAKRGERWRIYGRASAERVVGSTLCDGSRRLRR